MFILSAFSPRSESESIAARENQRPIALSLQSAKVCQGCHSEIYSEWQNSWMSKAFNNASFQKDFKIWQKYAKSIGEDANSCLRCHAPAALLTDKNDNAWAEEGVTCEICHRTAKISEKNHRFHMVMDPRPHEYVRNGNQVENLPHPIGNSANFGKPEFCAGCHLDQKTEDIFLERTYKEWLESEYAKLGVECIDCHMPMVKNSKSVTALKAVTDGSHKSHRFEGGHSDSSLLKSAVKLELGKFDEQGLELLLTNSNVGHNFPTGGAHLTELKLFVEFLDKKGKPVLKQEKVYKMDFVDENGNVVTGNQVVKKTKDSSLLPKETRLENFTWDSKKMHIKHFKARLIYYLIDDNHAQEYRRKFLGSQYQPVTLLKLQK